MGLYSGHAPAKLAFVGRDCFLCTVRSDAVWGCIRDTLPLTSPCSGTKRKTAVPLFFASTGGLRLSLLQPHTASVASTHCLYSPSLRRLSVSTGGIGLPLLQIYSSFIQQKLLYAKVKNPFFIMLWEDIVFYNDYFPKEVSGLL